MRALSMEDVRDIMTTVQRLTHQQGHYMTKETTGHRAYAALNVAMQRAGVVNKRQGQMGFLWVGGDITHEKVENVMMEYLQYNEEKEIARSDREARRQRGEHVAGRQVHTRITPDQTRCPDVTFWDHLMGRAPLMHQLYAVNMKLDKLLQRPTDA